MSRHVRKKPNPLANMVRQIKVRFALLRRRLSDGFSFLQHSGKRISTTATVPLKPETAVSAQPAQHIRPASVGSSRSRSDKHRRMYRIKNTRRMIAACGALAVVITGVVLLVTLTGGPAEQAAAQSALPNQNVSDENAASASMQLASVTVVKPVYESVRITEGVTASVVIEVQKRLMALGYMDVDETDGVFNAQTTLAVNHFKKQHGLAEDGIVDGDTYTLLMGGEAQYYTITLGAKDTEDDTDVTELQERLVELGYIDKTTGYFGTETEDAVKKFQKLNGLAEDGKIGRGTRELLYGADAVANFYSYGEHSDEILSYQQRLKSLGYLTTTPDGTFGPDTKEAVKRFQEANGLIADGYIGPATVEALMSDGAQGSALAIGCEGVQVTHIQERLKELGYFTGTATGYFGSATDSAVRSFQYRNGLTVDGKVGPHTLSVLLSSNAKESTGVNITGANVESFITVAKSRLGCRYVGGGKGPNVFDCSGFVYWCLNQVGVRQSYMTSHAWPHCTKYTKITDIHDLRRGDIIIYDGHCAIALGNGYQIDASSHYGKIVERKLTTGLGFICAFRIF